MIRLKIAFAAVFYVALSFISAQSIKGYVYAGSVKNPALFANVVLQDSAGKIIDSTVADTNGNFAFNALKSGTYSLHLFSFDGDTLVPAIKVTGEIRLKINIRGYCKYDASVNNKRCPVCHRKDKVIPIRYGLLITTDGKKDEHEGIKYISGGCEITGCDPHWHCKRDKVSF